MVVHQLHAMILNIAVTRIHVMMDGLILEAVKAHFSLLKDCFHKRIIVLL
jgi:hypothetical protein